MLIRKSYKFRLQPTEAQSETLFQWSNDTRFLWNWMLKQRSDAYKASEGLHKISAFDQMKQLPPMKEIFPWLGLVNAQVLCQTILKLDDAFVNFFQGRADYPKRKKRSGAMIGLRWPQNVKTNGRCVWLPKLGWVKIRKSRDVVGKIKNAIVKFDGLHWSVSIQVEQESIFTGNDACIGLDAGVTESIATSDGRLFCLPVATKHETRRKAFLARRVSRRTVGSKRHAKAMLRALVYGRHIINRVGDFRHKLTTDLTRNFSTIKVENLNLVGMTGSAKGRKDTPGKNVSAKSGLNRSMREQGHYETVRQLEYKSLWRGGQVIKVDPAYTSQKCAECGHVAKENRKTQSAFKCVSCGHEANADINAAKNILVKKPAGGQSASARGGNVSRLAKVAGPVNREPTKKRRFNQSDIGIHVPWDIGGGQNCINVIRKCDATLLPLEN